MILPIALLIIAVLFYIYLFLWKTKPTTHFYHKTSPLYIAHRGLHKTVPENTISAVERALKSGFTSVELDVISDSNNEIVCSHNIDLERETHGSGFVDEKEYSNLKHIVYRSAQGSKKNKNIPLLKTVLKRFKNETSFVLDVKTTRPMDLVLAKKIAALLKQLRLKESVIVSSFNPVFLLILKFAIEIPVCQPVAFDFAFGRRGPRGFQTKNRRSIFKMTRSILPWRWPATWVTAFGGCASTPRRN